MYRPRIIPVLLLKDKGLVKSVKFRKYTYIGDPINAVKIFNDLKADELIFLDIMASRQKRHISLDFVRNVGEEANMPFSVGGGIRSLSAIREIINAGAEKVVLNTYAVESPGFIKEAAEEFGSSTIIVSMDIKQNWLRKKRLFIYGGRQSTRYDPLSFAKRAEEMGAGELIVNSIDLDGTMTGYDLELIESVATAVTIPVIALGGASGYGDFRDAVTKADASAVAAGSMFVFHGPRRAVLINYPDRETIKKIFE